MDTMVNPARPGTTETDLYILRGLLRCADRQMIPAWADDGIRYYACPDTQCDRRLINAEEIEQLIWQRYVHLNADAADIVSRDQRRSALLAVLARITVGSSLVDLDYDWRD
ncbi:zinc ribbon domain-containing protein [Solwaraspora sp. WMMA2101]|uniref:zinc ribbon domain-containing protein n=1 Tax=Solwaraspora sp. WMMA2101 TaxID=3404124 RepID=UPI003B964C62